MDHKRGESRCKGRTKQGKPCRAAATEGGLCFFHANPNKASELGRIGGRSNRHAVGDNADPLPTLDNALAVRDTVSRLIAEIYAGRLHPRIAAGLAPLINLQLRAIEATDLEGRLAKLEKRLTILVANAARHSWIAMFPCFSPSPQGNFDGSEAREPAAEGGRRIGLSGGS